MMPVMLYKGKASYLCETGARLTKFKAAGWSETNPNAKKPEKGKKAEKPEEGKESEEIPET